MSVQAGRTRVQVSQGYNGGFQQSSLGPYPRGFSFYCQGWGRDEGKGGKDDQKETKKKDV